MTEEGRSDGPRVELYARDSLSPVPAHRRDQIRTRLKDLAVDGHVASVDVHTWRKKVPVGEQCRETALYRVFERWAEGHGVSLTPFFDTRECYSMRSGERGTRLVMPALCLAVYRDDDLQTVYPHTANDGTRSVMDCLRAIESAHRADPDRKPIEAE